MHFQMTSNINAMPSTTNRDYFPQKLFFTVGIRSNFKSLILPHRMFLRAIVAQRAKCGVNPGCMLFRGPNEGWLHVWSNWLCILRPMGALLNSGNSGGAA